jgi:hypothetical protein
VNVVKEVKKKQLLLITKLNLPERTYPDMAVVDISDYVGMLV